MPPCVTPNTVPTGSRCCSLRTLCGKAPAWAGLRGARRSEGSSEGRPGFSRSQSITASMARSRWKATRPKRDGTCLCLARCDPTPLPPVGPGEASRVRRPLSTLDDLVFGKDRLSPLERLVDRLFRPHAVVHHVKLGDAEDVLGVDLRDRRVVGLVDRQRRTDQRLLSVRGAVRVFV